MSILVRLLIALIIGAVVTAVAGLLLNHFWSVLLGITAGAVYFFGDART